MELKKLKQDFTICQIQSLDHVDFSRKFAFLSKTDDEISLLCESAYVPPNATASEPNWKGLKISGILDFGMVGVIAGISNILASAGISIFVVSTFNTDYIFVKEKNFDKCLQELAQAGYNTVYY